MEENKNSFFLDTMQGLLEAIAIDRGLIDMNVVDGFPGNTLRAVSALDNSIKDYDEDIFIAS